MKISTFPPKLTQVTKAFQTKSIPERTTTINSVNGRDVFGSDFVGYHPMRENPLEILVNLPKSILALGEKIFKNQSKKA